MTVVASLMVIVTLAVSPALRVLFCAPLALVMAMLLMVALVDALSYASRRVMAS